MDTQLVEDLAPVLFDHAFPDVQVVGNHFVQLALSYATCHAFLLRGQAYPQREAESGAS